MKILLAIILSAILSSLALALSTFSPRAERVGATAALTTGDVPPRHYDPNVVEYRPVAGPLPRELTAIECYLFGCWRKNMSNATLFWHLPPDVVPTRRKPAP